MYRKFYKRIMDIIISVVVLFITSPVLFISSILLFSKNNSKVFYFQLRPGYKERPFKIIKFKTMTDEKDDEGDLLPDVDRLTAIGRSIRNLSIDELPQLFNVLKGNMSLIGPRPLLFKYIPLYSEVQRRRHDVLPGITGWAQVNGRNAISWERKFEYDVWYVDNLSFTIDIKILWLTFKKVFKREGINQVGVENNVAFKGNDTKEQ